MVAGLSLALAGVLLTAMPAATQAPAQRAAGPDPYGTGDAAVARRAGYESCGPFPFGLQHGSADIDTLLGDEPLVWLETAHFRIGCSLAPLQLRGEREWVDRTRKELATLKTRLPAVKADSRDLDPWLRAHLIALRCEALYADVCQQPGVDAAAFPPAPGHDAKQAATFLGFGPHLGMRDKFGVLLLRKASSLARYTRRYMGGRESTEPRRHYEETAPMTFAVAEDSSGGRLHDDLMLHTQLAYNLAWQLYNGYRGYLHDLPPWLSLGLAHWHARRISPRFSAYEREIGGERETRDFWKWDERAAGLARSGALESLAGLMARRDEQAFGMEQHIASWAFVDWLLRTRRPAFRTLLHEWKTPFHAGMRVPQENDRRERAAAAWRTAFGADIGVVEAAWLTELRRGRN